MTSLIISVLLHQVYKLHTSFYPSVVADYKCRIGFWMPANFAMTDNPSNPALSQNNKTREGKHSRMSKLT